MYFVVSMKKIVAACIIICFAAAGIAGAGTAVKTSKTAGQDTATASQEKDFIKWVDFNVSYEALLDTYTADVGSHGSELELDWIDLLAYLSASNGNDYSGYQKKQLTKLIEQLKNGKTMESVSSSLKYYPYYQEVYTAILGEFVGEYRIKPAAHEDTEEGWETKYGLKVFSPIAKNYGFEDYDDFANSRSYGYTRKHTGHDLFGSIGTPVIAIEGGTVENIGWNQYGGWRIGIRSHDKKRYYYYAHLRKDHPYSDIMKEGAVIKAGDVIGYLGMTGYSTKENVNNINVPHLHMGLQLIFDESQVQGSKEIWIDTYQIVKLLQKNKSEVYKDESAKEYYRSYDIYEKE